jgi:membrane fusion protein (multidrug efflux system)
MLKKSSRVPHIDCFRPLILCSLLLAVFSCKGPSKEKKDTPGKGASGPSAVDVYIVKPLPLEQEVEVPGTLSPNEETAIHPEVTGRVTGIHFREGALVSKGALLVKLYDADLQAQLKKLQVQLELARKTEQRQQQLLDINGISQQDYDLSLLTMKNLEADIALLKINIDKTSIRAPYTGKLGLRQISPGALVNSSTLITTIRDMAQLKLEFSVPDKYAGAVSPGSLVRFSTAGSADLHGATVSATEQHVSADTRSMRVKALVNRSDKNMQSGSYARVLVSMGKNETALMVPTQAILPQARNKKIYFIRNGLVEPDVVTTGLRDTSRVEITSGIRNGDTILVSGMLSVKPGAKVNIKSIIQ